MSKKESLIALLQEMWAAGFDYATKENAPNLEKILEDEASTIDSILEPENASKNKPNEPYANHPDLGETTLFQAFHKWDEADVDEDAEEFLKN